MPLLGECVIILQNCHLLLQQNLQQTGIPGNHDKMLISKIPVIFDAVKVFNPTH